MLSIFLCKHCMFAQENRILKSPADTLAKEQLSYKYAKDNNTFYMALSSNMLFDALLVPNIGIEFYLAKQFSIQADWHYAWWHNDKLHNYWRIYGGGIEFRNWFGYRAKIKALQGHHIGLYGMILTYDIEFGGRGYLGDKWTWSAGISYGYSLAIAKRINIDFGLNIGYIGGEYKEYLPEDNHYVWQVTKNRNYIGLTKAYIALIWLIGKGNYNIEKIKR